MSLTGLPVYPWSELKPLIRYKLEQSVNSHNQQFPDLENANPGETFEEQKARLLDALESFDK